MEPEVRYTTTADGVSVAFSTLGEGTPLVIMPDGPWSHIHVEWQVPLFRRWYEALASGRMLVRYDGRGAGLSSRDVREFSLETMILDLQAVVSALALKQFDLFALASAGAPAIAYAVRNPEAVSHLVLWHCAARSADWLATPQSQAVSHLSAQDWELFTETAARFAVGWGQEDAARSVAATMRQAVAPATALAIYDAIRPLDVTALLQDVMVPTLVLRRRDYRWLNVEIATRMAAAIPGARMILLEGSSGAPFLEHADETVELIDNFLCERHPRSATALPSGMTAILFTDIVDSTVLTERLGDAGFRAKASDLDTSLRSIIGEAGGTPVAGKVLGDGVMGVFTSAAGAVDAARRCVELSAKGELQLHVGLHAGDVIGEKDNVYGGAVNIASRICGLCAPGEILVSQTVRDLARTSAGVTFEDRGEHALKGVEDPVRLFAVRAG